MIDHQEYRVRLSRCLDDRRDPLDDAELVAFLDAHPEHLDDFANERSDLREVASLPTSEFLTEPTSKWRTLIKGVAAAAATFALGWGIWQVMPSQLRTNTNVHRVADSNNTDHNNSGMDASHRPSRILSASLQEVEPRLHAAANYTVHERLVQTAKITLETYEQRSELR